MMAPLVLPEQSTAKNFLAALKGNLTAISEASSAGRSCQHGNAILRTGNKTQTSPLDMVGAGLMVSPEAECKA